MGKGTKRINILPLRIRPVAAAVATALGSFSGISIAADPAPDSARPEEIIVTATRRDTTVQEVPYNLSAISGPTLEQLQINDLSDIARFTPGLVQVDQGARDGSRLIMRGLNASGTEAPEKLANTTGGYVSTYFGETPVYIDLKLIDIDRVEVLRGPQGTLYGTQSMGGTLRYLPNKPVTDELTFDTHGRSYAMAESNDTGYDGDVVANVPLIEDKLALRAMYGYMYRPGFIDYDYLVNEPGVSCAQPGLDVPGECVADDLSSKADVNDEKTHSARIGLLWNITDSWEGLLNWHYQDQDIGGRQMNTQQSMAPIDAPPDFVTGKYVSGMRFEEPITRENNIYNLTLTHSGDPFDFVSATSYTDYQDDGQRDQTDLLLGLSFDNYWYYEEFPAFAAFTNDRRDNKIFTQEFRLVSDNEDSRWDWIAGAFYSDADTRYRSTEFAPNLAEFLSDFFDNPDQNITDVEADIRVTQDTEEFALFGELGYQLTDKLHGLVGARTFWLDDKSTSCQIFPLFDNVEVCDSSDGDNDKTLFKTSLAYQFTDDLLGYGLFSQGATQGGLNIGSFVQPEDRVVKPESVDNYEIGLRSTFLDGALIANGSLFYMDWTDLQLDSVDEAGFTIQRNGSSAETKGLELEASYLISSNWITRASYAYTTGELTEGCTEADLSDPSKTCALGNEPTSSGDQLPGFPEHQGSLLVGYRTTFQNGWDLAVNTELLTQSEVYTQLGEGDDCCRASGESLAGFTTYNAQIIFSKDQWSASLFADNLTNKYAETAARDTTANIRSVGSYDVAIRRYSKFMITPRTIGLDLRYRFGE